jgi:hypothetical protein
MRFERACELLEIDNTKQIPYDLLKMQYRKQALRFHPDKNPHNPDATQAFQEIHQAYETLLEYTAVDTNDKELYNEPVSFSTTFKSWLKMVFGEKPNTNTDNLTMLILSKLATMAETASLDYLRTIEKTKLEEVFEFAKLHREIFHFNDAFLEQLQTLIEEKRGNEKIVMLNPSLDDLLSHNLYKMHYNGELFIIPLWHSSLEYDLSGGGTMVVECNPVLPDHVKLDIKNNLYVDVEYKIGEIWNKEVVELVLSDNHAVNLYPKTWYLKPRQTVTLKHCGIPEIHVKNIYDVSVLKNVYINVNIGV